MIDLFRKAEMKFNFLVEWRKMANARGDSYLKDLKIFEKMEKEEKKKL